MSDWKSASAEAEMRKAEAEMMEKAKAKRIAEEDAAWKKIAESIYTKDYEINSGIDFTLNILREKGYNLPTLKS
jgi:hypothetical protein